MKKIQTMEFNTHPIWKNAMNFGAIGGIFIVLFRFILALTNSSFSPISILSGIIFIIVLIIGIKNLRDRYYKGFIKYGKALTAGILISVFMGIITGFYMYLEYNYIRPDNLTTFLENQEKNMILSEDLLIKWKLLKEGELDSKIEELNNNATPATMGFNELQTSIIKGFFFSLIIGAFLKKEYPDNYNSIQ